MDDYALALELVNQLEVEERRVDRLPRLQRFRPDAFELHEQRFMALFRLPRAIVRDIIEELRPALPIQRRRSTLTVEIRVLAALRFFATGSYQMAVGQDAVLVISQRSVSRAIKLVTRAISAILLRRWVTFPATPLERAAVKAQFRERYNFPGIIGAIDGTHVHIVPPPRDHPLYPEHIYVNHNGTHSLNVQLVVDSNLRILNCITNNPGRNHDSFIWRNSRLRAGLLDLYDRGILSSSFLNGDSGYPLEPFLMTPVPNPPEGSPSSRYNHAHAQARNPVERTNAVLKGVWRCCRQDRVLHYMPPVASRIVSSCVVLHNIAVHNRVPLPDAFGPEDLDLQVQQPLLPPGRGMFLVGQQVRQDVIRRVFT